MDDHTLDRFEQQLRELPEWTALPVTPDFSASVAERIRGSRPDRPRQPLLRPRPLLTAAAALLLLFIGLTLISGTVRDAVADAFGISGIRIEIRRDDEAPPATIDASQLYLGEPISLDGIRAEAGFYVAMLDPDDFGLPSAVYRRSLPNGSTLISLAYPATDALPNTAETNLGILLMQFEANAEVPAIGKSMIGDGRFEPTDVNGSIAYWIEGTTELQILGDRSGPRPSGNILLWEANGVTFRMESALSMDEAVAIAEEVTVIHASLLTPTAEPR